MSTDKEYYVYILFCHDQTLYCGIAADLNARIKTHNEGRGAKYTKGRLPVTLAYAETLANKSLALKREREIKKLTKCQKLALIDKQT